MTAYLSATMVSVSVALAGNKAVQKLGGGGLLGKVSMSVSCYVVHSVVRGGLRRSSERVLDAIQGDSHWNQCDGQGRE